MIGTNVRGNIYAGELSISGETIYGPAGWSVTIPPATAKILPPYNGLIDLLSGNCPAVTGQDGTTVAALVSQFGISSSDLAAMTNLASSVGMPCGATSAPGVLTQAQTQAIIASSPPAAATVAPSWAVAQPIANTVNTTTPTTIQASVPVGSTPMMTTSNGATTSAEPEMDWTPWLIGGAAVIGLYLMMGHH